MNNKFDKYIEELKHCDNIFSYRMKEGKCIDVVFPMEVDDIVPESEYEEFKIYFMKWVEDNIELIKKNDNLPKFW